VGHSAARRPLLFRQMGLYGRGKGSSTYVLFGSRAEKCASEAPGALKEAESRLSTVSPVQCAGATGTASQHGRRTEPQPVGARAEGGRQQQLVSLAATLIPRVRVHTPEPPVLAPLAHLSKIDEIVSSSNFIFNLVLLLLTKRWG